MALRFLRVDEDEILKKKSKEVRILDDRTKQLIADMKETMYGNNGVGLAAPQIGVLKRIVVIDIGEGPVVMINPVIIEQSGKKIDTEGCLSVTKYLAKVERPIKVKVTCLNEQMDKVKYTGKDMFARAICHELDHLDGILITDKAVELIDKNELEGDI